MPTTKVLSNVLYKQEEGTLTLTDSHFHYEAAGDSKTSVKCSWARVEKRQLSPATAAKHQIKLLLVSGKTAVFTVSDRKALEELRNDCQARMEAANKNESVRQSQRDNEAKMSTTRRTSVTTWEDEPIKKSPKQDKPPPCGWCCAGTALGVFCMCLICALIAVAAFLVYWYVLKDTDAVDTVLVETGIKGERDTSRPPDVGEESNYAIRNVNHEWNSEELIMTYQLSDYILDDSVSYILYDGRECRLGSNDITDSNQYLWITFKPPADGGANLNNQGRGSRNWEMEVRLNKAQIANAPFFTPNGLEAGRLTFCLGVSINYNQVDYWSREEEVNVVETAVQMDIDLSDFRRIEDVVLRAIVRPTYQRRQLQLRGSGSGSNGNNHGDSNGGVMEIVQEDGAKEEKEKQALVAEANKENQPKPKLLL